MERWRGRMGKMQRERGRDRGRESKINNKSKK